MKNVILGIIGAMVAVYTVILSLGLYSISSREDELENCLSEVMMSTMEKYYISPEMAPFQTAADSGLVEEELIGMLKLRLSSDSKIEIKVDKCDMNMGILSVEVSETFILPNGKEKKVSCEKTLIADREAKEADM